MVFKRCLIGLQKGVSKGLKGHLLQAKRALIRIEFMPFLFSVCELSLRWLTSRQVRRVNKLLVIKDKFVHMLGSRHVTCYKE